MGIYAQLIKWWQQQYTPNGNISAHTINNLSIDQFGGLFVQGDDSDYDFPPLPNYVFDNEILGRKGHARAFWNLFARDDEKKTQDKKAKRYLERAMHQILSAISRGVLTFKLFSLHHMIFSHHYHVLVLH